MLERMTSDPWCRVATVVGAGTVTLLTLLEEYATLPGVAAAFGAALVIGHRDRIRS